MGANDVRRRERLFLSFDPGETGKLAVPLSEALRAHGFEVDCHSRRTLAQSSVRIRECDLLVAILSPAATGQGPDTICLDELLAARFADPRTPILPVMATRCEVPLTIYLLQRVDVTGWERSPEALKAGIERLLAAVHELLDVPGGLVGAPGG